MSKHKQGKVYSKGQKQSKKQRIKVLERRVEVLTRLVTEQASVPQPSDEEIRKLVSERAGLDPQARMTGTVAER